MKIAFLRILIALMLGGTCLAHAEPDAYSLGWAVVVPYSFPEVKNYTVEKAFDNNPQTAWCIKGHSEDHWIDIKLRSPEQIDAINFSNGYQATETFYRDYSRVKTLEVIQDDFWGKPLRQTTVNFEDTFLKAKPKRIVLFYEGLGDEVRQVRLVIKEIFPGSRAKDICVSELDLEHSPSKYRLPKPLEKGQMTAAEVQLKKYLDKLRFPLESDFPLWERFVKMAAQYEDYDIAKKIFSLTSEKAFEPSLQKNYNLFVYEIFRRNPGFFVRAADRFFGHNFNKVAQFFITESDEIGLREVERTAHLVPFDSPDSALLSKFMAAMRQRNSLINRP